MIECHVGQGSDFGKVKLSADICFVSVQHEDNNLLKSNEINIFMSVENMVPPEPCGPHPLAL